MNPFSWKNRNRDLAVILSTFLLGLAFMLLSGTLAIAITPQWTVKANMDSKLNPDDNFGSVYGTQVIEPVSPAILTQATWQAGYLTPFTSTPTRSGGGGGNDNATATLKPQGSATPGAKTATAQVSQSATLRVTGTVRVTGTATVRKTGTATRLATASKTWIVFIPSITPKPPTAKPGNTSTKTRTPSQTFTSTITKTSTKTPTLTKTKTVTKTATPTKTNTATKTATPTKTFTPTITLTPTRTFTPSVTFTPSITLTPTLTLAPTLTPTSTITLTFTATLPPTVTATWTMTLVPTITETPSITPTATTDPVNWGPGDGIALTISDNDSVTYMLSPSINDHGDSGDDLIYYDQEYSLGSNSISLDHIIISVGNSMSGPWFEVFNWGNGTNGTTNEDANSSVNYILRGYSKENDNELISTGLVNGYGIGIDLFSIGVLGNYTYIRIECPPGTGLPDGCDLDAIDIIP